MAYTVTTRKHWVGGDTRAVALEVTADAATQNVNTNLKYIHFFTATPKSMVAYTTLSAGIAAGWVINKNKLAAGTAANGYLAVSNATSGDEYEIVAYGR